MSSSLIYSFIAFYLLIAVIIQGSMCVLYNKKAVIGIVTIAPLVLLLVPINDLPVIYYFRGAFGDLSIITASLLLSATINYFFKVKFLDDNSTKTFYIFIFIFGLFFYITSLGVGQVDLYSFGYSQIVVPMIMLTLAFLCTLRKFYNLGLLLLLSVIAFNVGFLESNNIWDYVLDPFLWLYTANRTFKYFIETIKEKALLNS